MAKQAKPEPKQEPASKTRVVKGEVEKAVPARAPSPFEEMDRMMESFFPRGWMRPFRWELPHWPELRELRMPKVDVIDRADEVVVKAEVPGVDKKDLEVSMTENTVTIKGSTSHEEKEEKGDYYRCEISRGAFARTVALPSDIDTTKAKASFRDGILELTIPKVEKSKRRVIRVD